MLIKTHLAIAIFAILLFFNHVNSKVIFVFAVLIATVLPDIDTAFSTAGKSRFFRILQFFVAHRGPIHSFTLCIPISIFLAFVFPLASFGFFLGYSLHLLSDSFTKEGIVPFWPYPKRSSSIVRTGGMVENSIFLFFVIADLLILLLMIF